jgi:uncharacterized protein (DUF58 family)
MAPARVRDLRRAVTSVIATRRGIGFAVAAVATFVAAPLLSLPALLYVTGLLAAMIVLSAGFVLVGHSRVRVERSFAPRVVALGAPSRVTVRLTNQSTLPCLEADWDDHLPHGVTGASGGTLPALGGSRGADSSATVSYDVHGMRRGQHLVGPLHVEVHDPFGLISRRHSFGGVDALMVLPARVDLPPITPRGASDDGATRPAPQSAGVGDDDIIARAYLPGDALKRIHWKATAHRAELMVRQEEQQVTPRAAVIVDAEPRSQGTALDRKDEWEYSPALEWSVVAAASITAHLARAGYVVALQSNGTQVDRVVAEGHDTLEDAMVDLALLQPEPVDRPGRHEAEGAAFVVLGRLTVERARQWVAALSTSRTILALVARGTPSQALDVLDGARWNVVTWSPQDDLADAWSSFDAEPAGAVGGGRDAGR